MAKRRIVDDGIIAWANSVPRIPTTPEYRRGIRRRPSLRVVETIGGFWRVIIHGENNIADDGHTYAMIQCFCGDVFRCGGTPEKVEAAQAEWTATHRQCVEKKLEGHKVFWMSFCDNDRPAGSQFLGACLINVTAEEADAAAVEVLLRFPLAQPEAEWIAAATKKAHQIGCNPGGEIASMEVPADHPMLARYTLGVLMDRATIERIDAEIKATQSLGDCVSCDGYVLQESEAPHCPTCARLIREGKPL